MRFKNLLGLLALGGVAAYAHKKRGGEFTLASIKESLKGAADKVQNKAKEVQASASKVVDKAASSASKVVDKASAATRVEYEDDRYGSGFGSNFNSGGNGTNRPR